MEKQTARFYSGWFLIRVVIGIIFVYSGLGKLVTPVAETRALFYEYALLPDFAVPWIALLFPWVEFFTGSFLVLGYLTRLAALAVAGFTFCFVALLGSEFALKGHFPLDCGCFAGSWKLPTAAIFFMDIVNFLLTLRLVRIQNHRWSLDQWMASKFEWSKPLEFRIVATGAILTACLAMFAVALRSFVPSDAIDVPYTRTMAFGLPGNVTPPLSEQKRSVRPAAGPVLSLSGLPENLPAAAPKHKPVLESTAKPAVSLPAPSATLPAAALSVSSPGQRLPLKQNGNPSAPVEILEYTDFQCPACRSSKPILAGIMAKYPGQVRLVFKHYPLPGHVWAKPAHRAAECAHDQGRFWPYHDLLYGNQQAWAVEKAAEVFEKFAAEIGRASCRERV